ncbi:MAG: 2,3-bisphosphoglycerate-independent phosphoglycerate mutase [Acidobacteriota bacterium]|nr:2,3-bisphosphoglycerate-independent phosphoglycerate mutase [Acidobacteriota bacterium]
MSTKGDSGGSSRRRKGQLVVVSSKGTRQRFLRGMVTHDLVQRGLDFDDAYTIARSIRDQLSGREEVSTSEVRDLIQQELEKLFGPELPARLVAKVAPVPDLQVLYRGQKQPFSRGLLARSMHAAGLDMDRAYRLVTELEGRLRQQGIKTLSNEEITRQVGDLLEQFEGSDTAQRYRMVRRIHHLPRPLVIYLGGGSGTGKSTLALELAPLLRIYRINATDTIRQVMRMIFSPQILPALHGSSFEAGRGSGRWGWSEGQLSQQEDDPEAALITNFEEQATRVAVGVRAVVERSIAENMHVLMEGVHLVPPLVPFNDLEGAVYQVPIMLGTLDEETHRGRFLARGRVGGRRAERYMENFGSIRTLHDYILQQAEHHEVPLVDTSRGEPPVVRTIRLVTSLLQKRLPYLGRPGWEETAEITPTLLVIIDGMADRPVRALGGRTPLQAAEVPTLDRLAREGQCGLADPVAPGVVPDTAAGSLALFGQSPLAMKRGPVEALGAGIQLSPGDIALRGNFATVDEQGNILDRRAGRIRDEAAELAQAIDHLPLPRTLSGEVEVRVGVATEHRLAIVLRGEGLSSSIIGSDPGEGAVPCPPLTPRPVDPADPRAVYTASVLALFEQAARQVLEEHPINARRREEGLPPANILLTRGAGRVHNLVPLEQTGIPLKLACISGDQTLLGLASWLGAKPITGPEMTANLDTDLGAKFAAVAEQLERADLVILHLKGADIAAHDRRPELKVGFLEALDEELGKLLDSQEKPLRVAVAADHATLSESGQHSADPTPVLIWGHGLEADEVSCFDEQSAAAGALQRFPLQMLLGRLFDLS